MARPLTAPQNSNICQGVCISALATILKIIRPRPASITKRGPSLSTSQPTSGPAKPKSSRPTDTAEAIRVRLQPVSCSSGTISTPAAALIPADTSSVATVTPTTTQP